MRPFLCLILLCCSVVSLVAQSASQAERYLLGIAPVGSVERAFVESSAQALMALATADEIVALATRHAAHPVATVRLVVLEAAARGPSGLRNYGHALLREDQATATWAMLHLEEAGLSGALVLLDAAAVACPWRAAALDALQRLRGEQRRVLLAAVLARPCPPARVALLAELAGLPAGAALQDILPSLYADERLFAALPDAARQSGSVLAPQLPVATLLLESAALAGVLDAPLPAHAPFLLATAPTLAATQRVAVARALALLAHPAGSAMLTELLAVGAAAERVAAFAAAVEARAQVPIQALLAGLLDRSDEVRWAAAEAADSLQAGLPASEAGTVLSLVPADVCSTFLDMVQRNATPEAFEALLLQALDPAEGFATAELAAELLLQGPRGSHIASLLQHPEELVRTLALARLARGAWDEQHFVAVETAALGAAALARATAALALGRGRSDRNRSLLLSLVRDAVPLVRECAALALAGQDNWHLVPALRALLTDADVSVRNAAACALLHHGFVDVRGVLEADCKRIWLQTRSAAALAAGPKGGAPQ